MSGSRSFRMFTNHFAAVSFHAKSRGYATLKYHDWQFKRFYRIFVYILFSSLLYMSKTMRWQQEQISDTGVFNGLR